MFGRLFMYPIRNMSALRENFRPANTYIRQNVAVVAQQVDIAFLVRLGPCPVNMSTFHSTKH